jgi:hypothetical protein
VGLTGKTACVSHPMGCHDSISLRKTWMDLTGCFGLTPEKTLANPEGSAKIPNRFSIAPAKMFPRVVGQLGFSPGFGSLLVPRFAPQLGDSPAIRRATGESSPAGESSRVRGVGHDIH